MEMESVNWDINDVEDEDQENGEDEDELLPGDDEGW